MKITQRHTLCSNTKRYLKQDQYEQSKEITEWKHENSSPKERKQGETGHLASEGKNRDNAGPSRLSVTKSRKERSDEGKQRHDASQHDAIKNDLPNSKSQLCRTHVARALKISTIEWEREREREREREIPFNTLRWRLLQVAFMHAKIVK
jgi:hypothetical protein